MTYKNFIVKRLKQTLEEMANCANVNMNLWDRHSNACLEAVEAIEQEIEISSDMVNKAWNEGKRLGMTGSTEDFRAVLESVFVKPKEIDKEYQERIDQYSVYGHDWLDQRQE